MKYFRFRCGDSDYTFPLGQAVDVVTTSDKRPPHGSLDNSDHVLIVYVVGAQKGSGYHFTFQNQERYRDAVRDTFLFGEIPDDARGSGYGRIELIEGGR